MGYDASRLAVLFDHLRHLIGREAGTIRALTFG